MKNMFIQAHKMTREMVEKYGVDYQLQFSLNLSYLLEKGEEKEMLNESIKKELKEMEMEQDIERVEKILSKYKNISKEIVEDLYSDANIRRSMKARGYWDDKTTGIDFEKRYTGKGNIEITRQKLWVKGDKVRVYYDIKVDGQFTVTGNWIKIK